MMTHSYDIFKLEPDGAVLWITAAKTWAEAEAVARQHASKTASPCLIFDQVTRSRTVVETSATL
jgi:hypothetical protein